MNYHQLSWIIINPLWIPRDHQPFLHIVYWIFSKSRRKKVYGMFQDLSRSFCQIQIDVLLGMTIRGLILPLLTLKLWISGSLELCSFQAVKKSAVCASQVQTVQTLPVRQSSAASLGGRVWAAEHGANMGQPPIRGPPKNIGKAIQLSFQKWGEPWDISTNMGCQNWLKKNSKAVVVNS